MNKAIVTVCIPVYNADRFILDTLNSVSNQTFKNLEVIIIDDCSSDGSVGVIENWLLDKGENFKFIKNCVNIGLLKCCNLFLKNINTEYFQILGHDDIIYPNKIIEQFCILDKAEEDVAMVYGNMHIVNSFGDKTSDSFFDRSEYNGIPPSGYIYEEIIKGNFINSSSVLCKTNLVKQVGGFDEDLFFDDWPMWIKLSVKFKILFTETFLGAYRVSNNSMIHSESNKEIMATSTFYMYQKLLCSNFPNPNYLKLMLRKFAIYIFKLESKNAKQFLSLALKEKFDFKLFIYFIMSSFKIKPHNSFLK